MKKVNIEWEKLAKRYFSMLNKSSKERAIYFTEELIKNPFKSDWDKTYNWEKLKYDTYKGRPIYSLRLNRTDRFCYSVNDEGTEIILITIISTKNHYSSLCDTTLREIRSMCVTKRQKMAFNGLLNSFKFDIKS